MKKLSLLLLTLLFSISANSQIYYKDEKLGTSRIQGTRFGNLLGAYVTVGLSPANQSKVIEGKKADTKIFDSKPQFTIKFESKKDQVYMNSKNMEYIVLVSWQQKGSARRLRVGKYGLVAGIQTNISEKELIPISIEEDENEENTFIVKPKEELKKGEYAFYYIKDDIEPNNVYDFQISK